MIIRIATLIDIPQIQIVRHSVKENVLSNPALVTDADCAEYLTVRGRGWVCEADGLIVGFAIVDFVDHNIWALFLDPAWEGRGIGQRLMAEMLQAYFAQTETTLWLGTEPGSRAERFYLRNGWTHVGMHGKGELKFELTFEAWQGLRVGGKG
jgi:GNAT superfamily N-acetyltransferase